MQTDTWKLEWNEELSVGISDIDAEHRHFIELVNNLNRAILDRKEWTAIRQCMQLILDDAGKHFAHEEALFREWTIPAQTTTQNGISRLPQPFKRL